MIDEKQALVLQRLDSAIQWINLYPVDRAISFPSTYNLVETSSSNCLVKCRRAFGVAAMGLAVYENEIQALPSCCFFFHIELGPPVIQLVNARMIVHTGFAPFFRNKFPGLFQDFSRPQI